MDDEQLCGAILGWFRRRGFEGDRLPPAADKSPDLAIRSGGEHYLIEVKEKGDDPAVISRRDQALNRGEVADFSEGFAARNTVAGIIKTAAIQLDSRARDNSSALRIAWIQCSGSNPEAQGQQVHNTAFGSCFVCELEGDAGRVGFFVRESAFYRHRNELDGIVVSDGDSHHLLLNSHSPRRDALRRSALACAFGGSIVDPDSLDSRGEAFVADCAGDRRDEPAVLRYLEGKYGTAHLFTMDLGVSAGIIRVPPDQAAEPATEEAKERDDGETLSPAWQPVGLGDHAACLSEVARLARRVEFLDATVIRMAKRLRSLGEDTAELMAEPWSLESSKKNR